MLGNQETLDPLELEVLAGVISWWYCCAVYEHRRQTVWLL